MRTTTGRWAIAAVAAWVLALASCGEEAVVTPPGAPGPRDGGVIYADSTSDGDTTTVADTLYGYLAIGSLNPDDEVTIREDTILKNDTIVIGQVVDPDSVSSGTSPRSTTIPTGYRRASAGWKSTSSGTPAADSSGPSPSRSYTALTRRAK